MRHAFIVVALTWSVVTTGVPGQGIHGTVMTKHHVDATVDGAAATTKVSQVFVNRTARPVEGVYLFPVPATASMTDFTFTMNGRVVRGEVLDARTARAIYERIVRRRRDPALLEYAGSRLFRASLFPIPPRGKAEVTLTYVEEITVDGGVHDYSYPLRSAGWGAAKVVDTAMRVRLRGRAALRSIFSSSHEIEVSRHGEREATVSFERGERASNRAFQLYWTVSDDAIGLHVLSDTSVRDGGYFMLKLAPRQVHREESVVAKDVLFVLDRSGSMKEHEKFAQALRALKYGLGRLGSGDRFGIVTFATDTQRFSERLVPANRTAVEEAGEWLSGQAPGGGTNIAAALDAAMTTLGRTASGRARVVVFLTDGRPTVGPRHPKQILDAVKKANEREARLFCFGVGYDVDSDLLDDLAEENGGVPDYFTPEKNLEIELSAFFDRIAYPVFIDLALQIEGLEVSEVYPKRLPDLFKGGELTVLGRYRGGGMRAVSLKGKVEGREREFVYEARFAEKRTGRDFIRALWARRKVGFLWDEVRLNGKNEELRDEIVRLGKQYGIATPYTSFLVTDDTSNADIFMGASHPGRRTVRRPPPHGGGGHYHGPGGRPGGSYSGPGDTGGGRNKAAPGAGSSAGGTTGGVRRALRKKGLKEADTGKIERSKVVRHQLGRTFHLRSGVWVDVSLDKLTKEERTKRTEVIQAFSERYFELTRQWPLLPKLLARMKKLEIAWKGKVLVFGP